MGSVQEKAKKIGEARCTRMEGEILRGEIHS